MRRAFLRGLLASAVAPFLLKPPKPIRFEGWVTRRRRFLVGASGPEYVSVRPSGIRLVLTTDESGAIKGIKTIEDGLERLARRAR